MDGMATFRSSTKKKGFTETRKEAKETMRKTAVPGKLPSKA